LRCGRHDPGTVKVSKIGVAALSPNLKAALSVKIDDQLTDSPGDAF
jgi:hypothetical protein